MHTHTICTYLVVVFTTFLISAVLKLYLYLLGA